MGDGQSHSWKYGFILSQVNTAGTKCDQTKSHLQLKLDFFFFFVNPKVLLSAELTVGMTAWKLPQLSAL